MSLSFPCQNNSSSASWRLGPHVKGTEEPEAAHKEVAPLKSYNWGWWGCRAMKQRQMPLSVEFTDHPSVGGLKTT